MLRKLNIRTRIMLGFAFVAGFIFAVGVWQLREETTLIENNDAMFEQGIAPMKHLNEMTQSYMTIRFSVREVLLTPDESRRQYYVAEANRSINLHEQATQAYMQSVQMHDARTLAMRYQQLFQEFVVNSKEIMREANSGASQAALAHIHTTNVALSDSISTQLNAMSVRAKDQLAKQRTEILYGFIHLQDIQIGLIAFGVLMTFTLGGVIAFSIKKSHL